MYIHRVPYGLIEWLFGKTIAENFNEISFVLCLIGALLALLIPGKTKVRRYRKPNKRPIYVKEDENGKLVYKGADKNKSKEENTVQKQHFGQYDRSSVLTDEEMKLAQKIRIERKEPTYEEWRAAQQSKKNEEARKKPEGENASKILKVEISGTRIKEMMQQEAWRISYEEVPKDKPGPEQKKEKTGYEEAYEVTPLLTYNESRNFRALQEAAFRKGYMICPKVRLADIIKPRNNENYMSNFGKIKSKHVDFAICDQNMKVLAVVELDDSSHDRPDRQERDKFVDSSLESNGIKVIHTRQITPDILDNV